MIKSLFMILALVFPLALLAQADDEIVKRLSKIGETAVINLNSVEPVISPPDGSTLQWYRRKFTAENLTIDVRRTDSLVSPYVGDLQLDCTSKGTFGSTEADIKGTPDKFSGVTKCKASYAFQSSKWTLKSFKCEKLHAGSNVIFEEIFIKKPEKMSAPEACFSAFTSE